MGERSESKKWYKESATGRDVHTKKKVVKNGDALFTLAAELGINRSCKKNET